MKSFGIFCRLLFLILVKLFLDYTVYKHQPPYTEVRSRDRLKVSHIINIVGIPFYYVLQVRIAYRVQARYCCCIIACPFCLPSLMRDFLPASQRSYFIADLRRATFTWPFTQCTAFPVFCSHPSSSSSCPIFRFLSLACWLHNPKYNTY